MYEYWYDQREEAAKHLKDKAETAEEYFDKTQMVETVRAIRRGEKPEYSGLILTLYDNTLKPLMVFNNIDIPDGTVLPRDWYVGVDVQPAGKNAGRDPVDTTKRAAAHAMYKGLDGTPKQRALMKHVDANEELTEMFMKEDAYARLTRTNNEVTDFAVLHINITC